MVLYEDLWVKLYAGIILILLRLFLIKNEIDLHTAKEIGVDNMILGDGDE